MSLDNLSSIGHGGNYEGGGVVFSSLFKGKNEPTISQTIDSLASLPNMKTLTFGLNSIFTANQSLGNSLESTAILKCADLSSMFSGFKVPLPTFLPQSKSSGRGR